MWIKRAKKMLFSHKTVLMGLIFVLTFLILSCGHVQIIGHSDGVSSAECNRSFFLANYTSTKDSNLLLLSTLLLAFVALALLRKNNIGNSQRLDMFSLPSLTFLKLNWSIVQLYDPILKAFRRGILHPQIYSPIFVTG